MRILIFFILVFTACTSGEGDTPKASPDSFATKPIITSSQDSIPVKPEPVDSVSAKSKTPRKDTLKPPKPAGGTRPIDKEGSPGDGKGTAGSGTTLTAATLAQTLSRMESQLTRLSLTGSQDHDYLVKMMALSYQATKKIEQKLNAGEDISGVSNDFSNQSKMFNSAGSLLRTVNPGSGETRIPVTFKAEESKSIDHIYHEMRSLSNRIIASSDNPSVISFAERTVKMTTSVPD